MLHPKTPRPRTPLWVPPAYPVYRWTRLDTGWILLLALLLAIPLFISGPGLFRLMGISAAILAGLVFLDRRQARRQSSA